MSVIFTKKKYFFIKFVVFCWQCSNCLYVKKLRIGSKFNFRKFYHANTRKILSYSEELFVFPYDVYFFPYYAYSFFAHFGVGNVYSGLLLLLFWLRFRRSGPGVEVWSAPRIPASPFPGTCFNSFLKTLFVLNQKPSTEFSKPKFF